MTIRKFIIVVGSQGGDEGKGRIVDELITNNVMKYGTENVVVLGSNGGSNAGHTISIKGNEYNVHYLTSASVTNGVIQVLGAGKVIEPISLKQELFSLKDFDLKKRTFIDENTHITTIPHLILDRSKLSKDIGTTSKGIGPTYSSKYARNGIRLKDARQMSDEELREKLKSLYESMGFTKESKLDFRYEDYDNSDYKLYELNTDDILQGDHDIKNIRWILSNFTIVDHLWFRENLFFKDKVFIVESSNALLLDITNGTYPNVTSSNCTPTSIFESFGLNLMDMVELKNNIEIIGVMKSYPTRVGNGSLPTLMKDEDNEIAETIVKNGKEFGVTTGRKRRPGWPDLVLAKYSIKVNGLTSFNITRLDNLSHCDKIKVCVSYKTQNGIPIDYFPSSDEILKDLIPVYVELDGWKDYSFENVKSYFELHENVKKFIEFIEQQTGVPVKYINTGKDRGMMVVKEENSYDLENDFYKFIKNLKGNILC
jgi:adenylosuccinate synthase